MEIYNENGQILQDRPSFRSHMTKTFIWMFFGVMLTFAIAFGMNLNPVFLFNLLGTIPYASILIIIAQFAVVIVLSAKIHSLSIMTARILFLAYAVLTGLTFSILPFVYPIGTIFQAFLLAALYFGSLAVIGLTTKRDLTKIASICMAALMAMIIYSVIAMFTGWGTDGLMYNIIGLLIFAGITAWDAQKIKKEYIQFETQPELLNKLSVFSALQLYLDFINIFLYILRILANSKD